MDLLFITSNVGSLFDNVDGLQTVWLKEFYQAVHTYKPRFIALHCQEVGGKCKGKEYENHMVLVDMFVKEILCSPQMSEYNRARVYLDKDYTTHDHFTALGSIYLLHDSIHHVRQFDFKAQTYEEVCGQEIHADDLETNNMIEKERFPQSFWPEFKWSRKGYIRTRWNINDCELDLVNIHLFHDASNLAAWTTSPSIFSGNRHKALCYVLSRITDTRYKELPFFIFGDFNVRLDTKSVVETLCNGATMGPTVPNNTEPGDMKELVFQERDNNHKVLLRIESKTFEYFDQDVFRENNGKALLEFDKELLSFSDEICELDIHFPPSYPYSEVSTEGTQYANTRCPAWCDRILMSPSAQEIVAKGDHRYDLIGSEVCMGDHKPVFLYFQITP